MAVVLEMDMEIQERELLQTTIEQEREQECLENLDHTMAASEASYKERLVKVNVTLEEKVARYRVEIDKQGQEEVAQKTRALADTYSKNLKKQEDRFMERRGELDAKIAELKRQLAASEAERRSLAGLHAMTRRELEDLQAQVGEVSDEAQWARDEAPGGAGSSSNAPKCSASSWGALAAPWLLFRSRGCRLP